MAGEIPKAGTTEWRLWLQQFDPETRAQLMRSYQADKKSQESNGYSFAILGFAIFCILSYLTQSYAVGGGIGGPIIAGGVLYAMNAG